MQNEKKKMTMNSVKSKPYPLGATLDNDGCNFSIHAPQSENIVLALFDKDDSYTKVELSAPYAGIRHTYVDGIKSGQRYGFLIEDEEGEWQYIADPYAKGLEHALHYTPPFTREISFTLPKCLVTSDSFDWQDTTPPKIPREETVIFETHVKGLTQLNAEVEEAQRGSYMGLISPAMMSFFKSNHINTIQLLPIAACMHEPHLLKSDLVNYWGYNPYLFMVPDPRYAQKDAVTEFKTVVRELHKQGIEVVLDVVYNHSAEAGEDGPVFHLKGLDTNHYITHGPHYANFTGCGNTLDLNHQPTLNLVMDTLRYWVQEYHIDGFRFDLAATLGRNGEEFTPNAAFFRAVAQDPVLQDIKLIAEPWDIGPNGYQVGNFPFGWNETNDKLRDISRSFWRGDQGFLTEFATRLMGSRDLYSAANWPFKLTVNYITYHDGFTLQDLVSYKHKHNEKNGEQNRDGHGDNRSDNYGVEGPTDISKIVAIRQRQKRNFMATLLFSFGIPHILTADVLSHSQNGNNNAYCQDNEISWLNWELSTDAKKFQQWLSGLLEARKQHMVPFIDAFSGPSRNHNRVFWRRVDGEFMDHDDWNQVNCVALHIGIGKDGKELMYLINRSEAVARFALPETVSGDWRLICDTNSYSLKEETATKERIQPPMTLSIWQAN